MTAHEYTELMTALKQISPELARRDMDRPTAELEARISEATGERMTLTPEGERFLRAALRYAARHNS